jgi:urea transporter
MSLAQSAIQFPTKLRSFVDGVLGSYAEVFFLSKSAVGLVLVVGTLLNWRVGAAGLLAVGAAFVFARLAHMDPRTLQAGYYTYNPLLVGLSLGATLAWSWLTALVIVIAGVMAFMLTTALVRALRLHFNLPALSLPFVVASAVAHVALLRYSSLAMRVSEPAAWLTDDFGLPLCVVGFFKSLGAILFVPSVAAGSVFSLLLLWRSRILFFLAVGGYYLGTALRAELLGSAEQAFLDVYGFNFILIAMALGGVFLIPSIGSFAIAASAVAVSMLMVDASQVFAYYFAVPAYTLPFNLVTLGVLYTLAVSQYPGFAKYLAATPEETLENDLVRKLRFPDLSPTLRLPFFGKWTVWQAFDDEWTHQGEWRYAYDFVITNDDAQPHDHARDVDATHDDDGSQLEHFYCYRKPVLSPCRGRVVKVVDDLPDNPIGRVDKANNWGNAVVIYDERGFYVELSHFAQHSLKVRVGDHVEPGQALGLCGNSGYSPQPHLHVQVQATDALGAATMPFCFARYAEGDEFHSTGRPVRGTHVEAVPTDSRLEAATDFLLNDKIRFEIFRKHKPAGELMLDVKMAIDGTYYFHALQRGKLYFGKLDGTFYFFRLDGRDELLGLLYAALPRLPLVRGARLAAGDVVWRDVVPIGLVASRLGRLLALAAAPLIPRFARAAATLRYVGPTTIESSLAATRFSAAAKSRIEIDPTRGITSVHRGDLELRLKAPAPQTPRTDALELELATVKGT